MYTYVGNGHFVSGVPARSMTDSEFAQLSEDEQANVLSSGLYEHRDESVPSASSEEVAASEAHDEPAEPASASVEAASNIAEPAPVAPDAAEAPNAQSA